MVINVTQWLSKQSCGVGFRGALSELLRVYHNTPLSTTGRSLAQTTLYPSIICCALYERSGERGIATTGRTGSPTSVISKQLCVDKRLSTKCCKKVDAGYYKVISWPPALHGHHSREKHMLTTYKSDWRKLYHKTLWIYDWRVQRHQSSKAWHQQARILTVWVRLSTAGVSAGSSTLGWNGRH